MSETPTPSKPTPDKAPRQPERDLLAGVRRTLGLDQGEGLQDTDARPPMVEFRTHKAGWIALPYRSLIEVYLEKNKKWPLLVKFSDRLVRISGINMEGLYLALVQQRALVVIEQDERHDLAGWKDELDEDEDMLGGDEDIAGRIFIASIEFENRSKSKSDEG